MSKLRVLVACEFSGIVRDSFAALGHDAWSADILPTERPGQHIINDVRNVLDWDWDLMIAHPPCEKLTYAANHCWNALVSAEAAGTTRSAGLRANPDECAYPAYRD